MCWVTMTVQEFDIKTRTFFSGILLQVQIFRTFFSKLTNPASVLYTVQARLSRVKGHGGGHQGYYYDVMLPVAS